MNKLRFLGLNSAKNISQSSAWTQTWPDIQLCDKYYKRSDLPTDFNYFCFMI